ncbi:MAG: hypothetical protein GX945_04560 [Lentisphaerae bacterium]|nr:hypothetical protein [Lentisphaerota bacterium]
MKTAYLFMPPLLGGLLLLAACHTVEPPLRPVAYLFPSVRTMAELEGLKAQDIAVADLAALLDEAGCGPLLRQVGLLDHELGIVARGLADRGYAELDARRSAGPIPWVTFAGMSDGRLEITAAFRHLPPESCRAGINYRQPPREVALGYDRYGRPQMTRTWAAGHAELRQRQWPKGGPEDYWEMRWLFPLPR